MKLGRINHIGVATPSIADSIVFYRDVMGATKIHEPFDLPEQEVADILGIAVGTVKSQTSRGAKQLADLLEDLRLPDQLGGWEVAR